MPSSVNLKALGLNYSPNNLELPEGSLLEAKNVIIRRDNVVEPRRGFNLYGTQLSNSTFRVKQLASYKERLFRHYENTLAFDSDGLGTFLDFNGSYAEVEAGLRIKSIEANGNFYFTTSEGIKKISASSASQFSTSAGYITQAGGIKALDLTGRLNMQLGNQTGFLPNDSAVAYRVLWNIRDANDNVVPGTPSSRFEIYNQFAPVIVQDSMRLFGALDDIDQVGSMIDDGNYLTTLELPISASGAEIRTSLVSLAEKLDVDIRYANDTGTGVPLNINTFTITNQIATITFSGAPVLNDYLEVGKAINLKDFTLGSTSFSVTSATTSTDRINTSTAHDFSEGDAVSFTGGGLPTPLVASTVYYVRNPDSTSFQLSLTPTGSIIDITATGTGTVTKNAIGNINSNFNIASINDTTDTITFLVPNVYGTVTVGTGYIESYQFRSISQPAVVPDSIYTHNELQDLADYYEEILLALQDLPQGVVSNTLQNQYITPIQPTTSTTVILDITVPQEASTATFYQVYRGNISQATGNTILTDLTPDDEMQLVFEGFPTSGEISSRFITLEDITPDAFRGAFLYTNEISGEGITQANDLPPLAKDINRFKGSIFYANTKTRQRLLANLLGVQDIVGGDTLTITTGVGPAQVYTFVLGVQEVRDIVVDTFANTTGGGYFTAYSASDNTSYYFWVNKGSDVDPAPPGFDVGVEISVAGLVTAAEIATRVNNVVARYVNDFESEILAGPDRVRITNSFEGTATNSVVSSLGGTWAANLITNGAGENAALNEVLLSNVTSVAQAVDLTSRSLIRVINKNANEEIYAFYLTTAGGVPGRMFFEARTLTQGAFTITASTQAARDSFDPSLPLTSANEVKVNRVYYSKIQQPEAVPITNFIDLGAGDKQILRIFPLRDSLFVFKEDGLYRISGETIPFTNALFDGSAKLLAPDSIDLLDNMIFGWTDQGVQTISEAGVSSPPISRPIDTEILKLATTQFTNFKTATWGVGYDSDSSYTVYTVKRTDDTVATIGYRYSGLTNSWTTVDKTATCGIIFSTDDKMYLGSGDRAFIEKERKNFNRYDYSDREFSSFINNGLYNGNIIKLLSLTDIEVGDVITQEQTVSVYDFNMLLKKLDLDLTVGLAPITSITTGTAPLITTTVNHNLAVGNTVKLENTNSSPNIDGLYTVVSTPTPTTFTIATTNVLVAGTSGNAYLNYEGTLRAVGGNNIRTKLEQLAAKLDGDPGLNTTTYASTIANKTGTITANSAANPTVVTSAAHDLFSNRVITISSSNSTPTLNGTRQVTVTSVNTFTVPVNVTVAGTAGSWSTDINNFQDILACFNKIIDLLNLDTGATFSNYVLINNTTTLEAVIDNVNKLNSEITLNLTLNFIVGPITVFKAIDTSIVYAPNVLGDPVNYKHCRESQIMFNNKAFTRATLSFASDLFPAYRSVEFKGDGNGIFGHMAPGSVLSPVSISGFGGGFFGGTSNAAPFRTYIPRDIQRCRYIVTRFQHRIARESYAIYAVSITAENTSSPRTYRR